MAILKLTIEVINQGLIACLYDSFWAIGKDSQGELCFQAFSSAVEQGGCNFGIVDTFEETKQPNLIPLNLNEVLVDDRRNPADRLSVLPGEELLNGSMLVEWVFLRVRQPIVVQPKRKVRFPWGYCIQLYPYP